MRYVLIQFALLMIPVATVASGGGSPFSYSVLGFNLATTIVTVVHAVSRARA